MKVFSLKKDVKLSDFQQAKNNGVMIVYSAWFNENSSKNQVSVMLVEHDIVERDRELAADGRKNGTRFSNGRVAATQGIGGARPLFFTLSLEKNVADSIGILYGENSENILYYEEEIDGVVLAEELLLMLEWIQEGEKPRMQLFETYDREEAEEYFGDWFNESNNRQGIPNHLTKVKKTPVDPNDVEERQFYLAVEDEDGDVHLIYRDIDLVTEEHFKETGGHKVVNQWHLGVDGDYDGEGDPKESVALTRDEWVDRSYMKEEDDLPAKKEETKKDKVKKGAKRKNSRVIAKGREQE